MSEQQIETATSSPSPGASRARRVLLALAAVLLAATLLPAASQAAPPPLITQFCPTGSGAGQCKIPRGIATDPNTGNYYVADMDNNRISEFSPWGVFVKTWGWDVVASGPGDDTTVPEDQLEVCAPANGDVCKIGLAGHGAGQISAALGVAIDSEGDIWVEEAGNPNIAAFPQRRVQEFSPQGAFLLMIGGDVNKTKVEEGAPVAQRNLCTAASGDECQAATVGTGPGQFGSLTIGDHLDVGPGGEVYVGDAERIQVFEADGTYLESIAQPGERVLSLAIDPVSGDLYASFVTLGPGQESNEGVRKFTPTGTLLTTLPVKEPRGLAVDATGNLYVIDGESNPTIRQFTSLGNEIPEFAFSDGFDSPTGIATSSACGIDGVDLMVSNADFFNSFIRLYGPPPDPNLCPPPEVAPNIEAQYATAVATDEATLRAEINPNFWPDTTYYLEYGTGKCSEGGCNQEKPLPPGATLTTASTNSIVKTAAVQLTGLQPGTTYHYRFVADSSGGGPVRGVGGTEIEDGAEGTFHTYVPFARKLDCPNQAFRSGASARLPNCRAYEMVSPVDKNGADVAAAEVKEKAYDVLEIGSADGNRATFSSLRSFGNPEGAPVISQYLAARGAGGWSTETISPPRVNPPLQPPGASGQYKAFDENLCHGWLIQDADVALAPGAPTGVMNAYRRENCGAESYELLTPVVPTGFGPGETDPEYYAPLPQGHSADGVHTALRAAGALTPDACPNPGFLQVYLSSEGGPLRLVSALPPDKGGEGPCSHTSVGRMEGFTDGFTRSSVFQAVSEDGSRVFWSDSGDPNPLKNGYSSFPGLGAGKLYVRLNATEAPSDIFEGQCIEPEKACTVAISTATNTTYWGADSEGETAVYTVGGDLFEFDVDSAQAQQIAGGVKGVIGMSEDASRIYFGSTEALTGGQQNSIGDEAVAGMPNVYLAEGGELTFIATLGNEEAELDVAADRERPAAPMALPPNVRTSRVSPNGLHLAFTSAEPLSGYDSTDLASGRPDTQVFLYDAEPGVGAGELRCVSCNPGGARPRGRRVASPSTPEASAGAAATLPGWAEQLKPTRLLSADGDRLYFQSFDALVLADTNGKQDVYEWQRAGSRTACEAAGAEAFSVPAGGCISLISSGQDNVDSEMVDASEGGRDVFFITDESLLPQDEGLNDVYDAREGGGFPQPPSPPAPCLGEACSGPARTPESRTPASATFQGAGNTPPPARGRCPKGKRRVQTRKGKPRCVKPRPTKRKKANDERRVGR